VDDTGQSIGKRYARTDEIGIPFGITVDYQTLEEKSVTLRELHTMKQLRVPLADLEKVLVSLSQETQTWEEVCKQYPLFEATEKDE
jgi:glycyl-tRNA synthetase